MAEITITNGVGNQDVTLVDEQWYQVVYSTVPGYAATPVYKKTNGTFTELTDGKFQADLTGDEASELSLGIIGSGTLNITIAAPSDTTPDLSAIQMRRTDGNLATQTYFYGDLKTNTAGTISFDGLPVGISNGTTYPTIYIKIAGIPTDYKLPANADGNVTATITNDILAFQLTSATAENLTITLEKERVSVPAGLYSYTYPKYEGFDSTDAIGYYGVESGTITVDNTTQP